MNQTDKHRLREILDLFLDHIQKAQPGTEYQLLVRVDRHGHVDLEGCRVKTEHRVC